MNQVKSYLQVPLVGRSALVSVSTVAGAWVKLVIVGFIPRLQSDIKVFTIEKYYSPFTIR